MFAFVARREKGYTCSDCAGTIDGDAVKDCNGVCGGDAVVDCAGVCGGTAKLSGCDNKCNSKKTVDCSGKCGGDAVISGCDKTCGSTKTLDCSGTCGGSAVFGGCDNACGSTKEYCGTGRAYKVTTSSVCLGADAFVKPQINQPDCAGGDLAGGKCRYASGTSLESCKATCNADKECAGFTVEAVGARISCRFYKLGGDEAGDGNPEHALRLLTHKQHGSLCYEKATPKTFPWYVCAFGIVGACFHSEELSSYTV